MQSAYIVEPSILLMLDDQYDIVAVKKPKPSFRPPANFLIISGLIAEPYGPSAIKGGYLHLDGMGCLSLFLWMVHRFPRYGVDAVAARYDRLFATGDGRDALRAVAAIFTGCWQQEPGEHLTFALDQWRRKPREMQALERLGALIATYDDLVAPACK